MEAEERALINRRLDALARRVATSAAVFFACLALTVVSYRKDFDLCVVLLAFCTGANFGIGLLRLEIFLRESKLAIEHELAELKESVRRSFGVEP